jgi:hypothetical protein
MESIQGGKIDDVHPDSKLVQKTTPAAYEADE